MFNNMTRAILIMILSSLTIIGLYDIFKYIKLLMLKPKQLDFSIVFPVSDKDENIEFKIRYLSELIDNKNYNATLIIADIGMDFQTLQRCYAATKQDNKIIICSPQEIKYFTCEAPNINNSNN